MRSDDLCDLVSGLTVGALESIHPSGFIIGGTTASVAFPPITPIATAVGAGLAATATVVQSSDAASELLEYFISKACENILDGSDYSPMNTSDARNDIDIDGGCHEDGSLYIPDGQSYIYPDSGQFPEQITYPGTGGVEPRNEYITDPNKDIDTNNNNCNSYDLPPL